MGERGMLRRSAAVAGNIFRKERHNARVIMGYLLGIAILGSFLNNFFRYTNATGEPFNILEPFIVIEQHSMNILFLTLGWLLVIADAPFIKSDTCFLLYRSGKSCWNLGMMLYLLGQALCYVLCLAAVTVITGCFWGYCGGIWSSPLYELAMDQGNKLGVQYNVTFLWGTMMRSMNVPQAFAVTILFLFCYLAFLGVILYVGNLLLQGIWGMVFAMGIHLTGYLLLREGWVAFSPLAHAIPGYFFDGTRLLWLYPCLFVSAIMGMACLSHWAVQRVDFLENAHES